MASFRANGDERAAAGVGGHRRSQRGKRRHSRDRGGSRRLFLMNATMMLLNLAYLGNPTVEAVEYVSEGLCTADQQRGILQAVTGCQARETLVDLREHMPNVSNVIQVGFIRSIAVISSGIIL